MRHFPLALAFLLLAWSAPTWAQPAEEPERTAESQDLDDDELEESDEMPSLIDQVRKEAGSRSLLATPPLKKYPRLEWHGYFRFRTDLFGEADLGTYAALNQTEYVGTSLFLPALARNFTNSSGAATFSEKLDGTSEKTVGTANMRLRLNPTVRISDALRITTTVDVLDNLVLGTTPEYLGNVAGNSEHYSGFPGPGVALDTFTATQVSPAAGINGLSDAITVKEAFAEWVISFDRELRPDSFTLGTLTVGRFAYDWGLGINTSRGDYDRNNTALNTVDRFKALDAEWGNYLDRAMWRYDFGPLSLMAGFGWLASGPTSRIVYDATRQAYDLEQKDDLYQFDLALYSRPQTRADFIERRSALFSGKPVFDWGLYVNFRRQDMVSNMANEEDELTWADYTADYAGLALADRDAWLITPDLFLRMDWRPEPGKRFYAALEGVAVIGNVANATGTKPATEVDVLQYGAAVESNITLNLVSFGLDLGLASGDSTELWATYVGKETPWGTDNKLGAYSFNQNYFVDLLLYREVLGTVSNSIYVRPHFDFDIIPTDEDAFGGALSLLYAAALDPDAYPGNEPHLGLEFDAHIFYEQTNRFLATAGFGAMIPLGALDRPADFIYDGITAKDAEWAWTLQGNLYFVF